MWIKISQKIHFFRQANRNKLILPLEKYFKTLKDMIIGTAGRYLFQSNNSFKVEEIILLKYGQLMLPAGHILDLYFIQYCIWLSNAAPFCENYTKLYFDAKHLEKGFNFFQKNALFQIKCSFIIKSALFYKKCFFFSQKSALSGQCQMLPWISRICPDQIHFQIK